MATCFCGCGRKVKMLRRPLNGTGTLVSSQLDLWHARDEQIAGSDLAPGLEEFVAGGEAIADELREITHGGPMRLTRSQRQITEWLNVSGPLVAALDAEDEEPLTELLGTAGVKNPRRPRRPATEEEKRSRREEIEEIRSEYEGGEGATTCPECGAEIADPGEYLAHVAGHG